MPFRRRGVRFTARHLEIQGKYTYREEHIPIILKRLDIRPGLEVIDFGCGTGFFTRLVARGLGGKGKVVGYDRNSRLLEVARRLAREEHLGGVTSFRIGRAESIPLPDESADRAVCHIFLWTQREPRSALREMIRVCRKGGIVGAVEGGFDRVIVFVPDDPRLSELYQKREAAYALGHNKLYGTDRGIGYKLPAVFAELGLGRVCLDGIPHVALGSEDFVPKLFKLQWHRYVVSRFEHPTRAREENKRILTMGGMTSEEVDEVRRLEYERSKRFLRDPSLLDADFSMDASLYFLTTGVKQ